MRRMSEGVDVELQLGLHENRRMQVSQIQLLEYGHSEPQEDTNSAFTISHAQQTLVLFILIKCWAFASRALASKSSRVGPFNWGELSLEVTTLLVCHILGREAHALLCLLNPTLYITRFDFSCKSCYFCSSITKSRTCTPDLSCTGFCPGRILSHTWKQTQTRETIRIHRGASSRRKRNQLINLFNLLQEHLPIY